MNSSNNSDLCAFSVSESWVIVICLEVVTDCFDQAAFVKLVAFTLVKKRKIRSLSKFVTDLLNRNQTSLDDSGNLKLTKRYHKHQRPLFKQPSNGRRKKQPEKHELSKFAGEKQARVTAEFLVAEKVDDSGELFQFRVSVSIGGSHGVSVDPSVSFTAVTSASVYAAFGSHWDYGFTRGSCLYALF